MFLGVKLTPEELYQSALNVISFIRDKEDQVYLMSGTILDQNAAIIVYETFEHPKKHLISPFQFVKCQTRLYL